MLIENKNNIYDLSNAQLQQFRCNFDKKRKHSFNGVWQLVLESTAAI